MRRTRVVHLVEALGLGGLERVVQTLARHASSGYDVEVVALVEGGSLSRDLTESVAALRILGVRNYYPDAIVHAARTLRRIGPDLIHSHGHFAGALGRSAGWLAGIGGLIHHLHTIDTTMAPRHHCIERFLARITDRVICCSCAVHRHAVAEIHLKSDLLRTIHNGIDPPPPVDHDDARRLLEDPPSPVVGCIGGLAPHKGQRVLIAAWSEFVRDHAPGTLVLVGEGRDRSHLEQLASSVAPGRVRFTGERTDARRLLPAFDVVVVPSLEREGLGLAALEAMDAGRPVIASRLGGLPEVVEDGRTGLLVDPGSVEAILAALRAVLEHPRFARSLGEEARRRVDSTFRAATMARRVEALYEEVLGVRRAA